MTLLVSSSIDTTFTMPRHSATYPSWPSAGAMLIDQDIVPQHSVHRPSILQPIYRRISPDDIVRLDPGDEITVVIPPVSKNTMDLGGKVLWMYCKMFELVVKRSCSNIHPADRPNVVSDRMASHHFFPRDGLIAMELQLLCRTSHVARLLLVKIIHVETILESTQEFKKS